MREEVEALFRRGMAARRASRPEQALRLMREAVALARASGDPGALARALHGQANAERDADRSGEALRLYEEAVPLARASGDPGLLAHTLRHHADVLRERGDADAEAADAAEAIYEEAVSLYRAHPPSALDLANALRPLAIMRQARGAIAEARALWTEARDLYEAAGVQAGVRECEARLKRLASV